MTRIHPGGWSTGDYLTKRELAALDRKQADALHFSADQTIWGSPTLVDVTLENATCDTDLFITGLSTPEGTLWNSGDLRADTIYCDSVIDGWTGGAVTNDIIPSSNLMVSPWLYNVASLGAGLFAAGWNFSTGTANQVVIAVIPSRCLSHGGTLSSVTAQFYTATPATGETIRARLFHGADCLSNASSSTYGSTLFSATTTVPSGTLVDKNSGKAYWLELTSSLAASITVFLLKIQVSYTSYGEPSWVRGGG